MAYRHSNVASGIGQGVDQELKDSVNMYTVILVNLGMRKVCQNDIASGLIVSNRTRIFVVNTMVATKSSEEVQMLRLTQIRKINGWSQARLGREAIIHPADISRFESGRLVPYAGQLERLAKALGVCVADASSLMVEADS